MITNHYQTTNDFSDAFYSVASMTSELRSLLYHKGFDVRRMYVETSANRPWTKQERRQYSDIVNQCCFLFGREHRDYVAQIVRNVIEHRINEGQLW